ncbi:MAG: hypothetical protein EAZ89_07785 [Bacteroidetes bacterium]|nr:MAG: hypothetical protein EAZ89_07785 [Bacteroidota bacterium]
MSHAVYLLDRAHTPRTSILYFVSGVVIALLPLFFKTQVKGSLLPDPWRSRSSWIVSGLKWLAFAWLSAEFIRVGQAIISTYPLNYLQADMMPIIRVMCQRFLTGKDIYAVIPEIWNNRPIYLPGMWAPFVPFELAGMDIRWGSVAGILLGLFAVWKIAPTFRQNHWLFLLVAIPAYILSVSIWEEKVERVIRFSEEGVVAGFYLFLAYALTRKNPVVIGLAIAGCLLSRYSFLFWVPAYGLYVFFFESRKQAIWITVTASVAVLLFFLIPYGFENFSWFASIPSKYPEFALQNRKIDPEYAHVNLGFSKFFSDAQVPFLFRLQLWATAGAPFLLLSLFAVPRIRKSMDPAMWGLASLKLTLVLFYNLVVVPVGYLFYVNTFLSLALWMYFVRLRFNPAPAELA